MRRPSTIVRSQVNKCEGAQFDGVIIIVYADKLAADSNEKPMNDINYNFNPGPYRRPT